MRTVPKFVNDCGGDTTLLLGYIQAMTDYDPTLRKMVEKAKDFDDLKTQLLNFCDKQDKFTDRVWEKYFP